MGHSLLVDGDGGGEALDVVHVGLVHAAQELAGVGGQGLHVPSLTFGVNGVEGQGAFAGAGDAGDDHQLVPGNGDLYVLEVVLPGSLDVDKVLRHRLAPLTDLVKADSNTLGKA